MNDLSDNIHLCIETGIVYIENIDTGKRFVINPGFSEEDSADFVLNNLINKVND